MPCAGDTGQAGQGLRAFRSGFGRARTPRLDDLEAASETGFRPRHRDLPGRRRGAVRIIACMDDAEALEIILAHVDAKGVALETPRRLPPQQDCSPELEDPITTTRSAAVPAARLRWRLAWWPVAQQKVPEPTGGGGWVRVPERHFKALGESNRLPTRGADGCDAGRCGRKRRFTLPVRIRSYRVVG